jgi:serine/threonine protein phosphatase 1
MKRFARMFRGASSEPAGEGLPPGYRLYAIGDVHGRDDLWAELLARVEAESRQRGGARLILVFLGDLIDRGPASSEVIERLRTLRYPGARLVFLAGNHEEVLLRILDGDVSLVPDWLRFGGAECLASYGLDASRLRRMSSARALEAIKGAIPDAHVDFLRSFEDTFRAGSYVFVHAGIRPGVPLTQQKRTDLRWIREPFLTDAADHGFIVVHGHTIREEVEDRGNRIGIDTGAYRSGVLTALGLEGSERWYVQARENNITPETMTGNPEVKSELDAVSSQSG